MIGFTISLDQLKSAPPEVRRWIEREAAAALTALSRPEPDPSHPDSASLAACTPEEAAEVYDLIKGNFLLSQVLFELARETPGNRGGPPLHALSLADMLRHTRLADGDHLVDCFGAITQAFRTVRNDPEASLFGFDQYGQVWIHQTRAFVHFGSSWPIASRQRPVKSSPGERRRHSRGLRRLTSDRARMSLSTGRLRSASISERGPT
ncbi:MAG: hypothetical protein JO320_00615 [Alphaproteobacteria bacterium]|nr:hypothetical protein [Alphaproteobacteria bacterium]